MPDRHTGVETLLVGIDAACPGVLEPLFESGATPTLSSLARDGAAGGLRSQIPPWTASAWPSLYTGANPGKHGVFGFLSFDGYDWNVVDATHVGELTLPEIADHHGLTSVVVNAPVTHPPPEIDGAVVPGYTAPEAPDCHPAGLLDELREAIGEYRVYARTEGDERVSREEHVAEYRRLARMRGETFRYLAKEFDPEFGFVQFQCTDTVCHELPGDREAIHAVYEAVDDELGAILDSCDPDTVVVASDHGIGPLDGYEFRINEYLREHGFIEAVQGGDGMPTWATIRDGKLRQGSDAVGGGGGGGGRGGGVERGRLGRALEALASVGFTTQRVGRVLERVGLAEPLQRYVPDDAIRAASEQVDFPASTAYARSRVECGVRIDLEGREPEGSVPPEEYDAVREELVSLLSAATTPADEPVFETVAPREAYFHGPYADEAVDVVAVPADFRHSVTTWLLGEPFGDLDRPVWDHHREGIVIAAGDGVKTGSTSDDDSADEDLPDDDHPDDDSADADSADDLPDADHLPENLLDGGDLFADAHLFDVAPTVLATLGLPRSDRMDGEPLPVVEPSGTETYPQVTRTAGEGVEDGSVERRLSELGYLE